MPVYAYICKCGYKEEMFWPVALYGVPVSCKECGQIMKKDFGAMTQAYHDCAVDSVDFDLTGKPIVYHTRGQLERLAKEQGCRVDWSGKKEGAKRTYVKPPEKVR